MVKGRGRVDISLKQPQFFLPIIRRWFNRLRWKPREGGANTLGSTATWLECVVDFELTTGQCLGAFRGEDLNWSQEAQRLAYFLKTLARTHTINWNGLQATYSQALRPTTDASHAFGRTAHVGMRAET